MFADKIAVRKTTANIKSNHNIRKKLLESVSKIAESRNETYLNFGPPISIGFGSKTTNVVRSSYNLINRSTQDILHYCRYKKACAIEGFFNENYLFATLTFE